MGHYLKSTHRHHFYLMFLLLLLFVLKVEALVLDPEQRTDEKWQECNASIAKTVIQETAKCGPYLAVVQVQAPRDIAAHRSIKRISPSHVRINRCEGWKFFFGFFLVFDVFTP